ncbi:hypothetical protein [Methylopila jiangsuensis]|uniref:hypothetical protein n=2 Tax=Methylopila jiangsuensis TaxID=586230 RepID=UPI00286D2926|nr:hypothetical protein [Methylopila jiangsuensis]
MAVPHPDLREIAGALGGVIADGDLKAHEAFRSLVESVTIARSVVGEPVAVDVQGRLSALLERDLYPTSRFVGGGGGGW